MSGVSIYGYDFEWLKCCYGDGGFFNASRDC